MSPRVLQSTWAVARARYVCSNSFVAATLIFSFVVVPVRSHAQSYGRDLVVGSSYVAWTSAVRRRDADANQVTLVPAVVATTSITAWLNPTLGLRAGLGYTTSPIASRDTAMFAASRGGDRLTANAHLGSALGALMIRPFGDHAWNLRIVRVTPFVALGGGVTRFDPRAKGPCIIAGEPNGCGVAFTTDSQTYLSQPRWRAAAFQALGFDMPLTRRLGLRLEAGDHYFMSPIVRLERRADGTYARPDEPTFIHGRYVQVGVRVGTLGHRPAPRIFGRGIIADSVGGEVLLRDVTVVNAKSVAPVQPVQPLGATPPRTVGTDGIYDVLLDVPNVSVDEITLEVDNVNAHVSLDAKVAKLVQLSVGADVGIERVYLGIRGVQAEAHLKVDLDNVATIVDRVLTTIDRNPEIITGLLETLETTVTTVGNVANTALQPGGVVSQAVQTVGQVANTALQPGGVVSQAVQTVGDVANTALQPGGVASQLVGTVGGALNNLTAPGGLLSAEGINALGQTITRVVDGTGRILERTLDQAGTLVGERVLGSVLQLPILSQSTSQTGQLVRIVRDISGALVEVTLDQAGQVLGTRVLQAGNKSSGAQIPPVPQPPGPVLRQQGGERSLAQRSDTIRVLLVALGVNDQGHIMQRIVEQDGAIVDRIIDPTVGRMISRQVVGSVLKLPAARQHPTSEGGLVRIVNDPSGGQVELTFNAQGVLSRMRSLKLGSLAGVFAAATDTVRGAVAAAAQSVPLVGPALPSTAPAPSAAVATAAPLSPGAPASPAAPPIPGGAQLISRAGTPSAGPTSPGSIAVSDTTPTLLLAQYTNANGQFVQRVVDAEGRISERQLNAAGQLVIRRRAMNARLLPMVREYGTKEGNFVRLVQDASGAVLELLFTREGKLAQLRVLQLGSGIVTESQQAPNSVATMPDPAAIAMKAAPPVLALLSESVNAAGQFVQRVVDPNSRILVRVIDATGKVLQQSEAANLLQLPVVNQILQPDGRIVVIARDVTGALLEVVLGGDRKVSAVRALGR